MKYVILNWIYCYILDLEPESVYVYLIRLIVMKYLICNRKQKIKARITLLLIK